MATKIRNRTSPKQQIRFKHKKRIRSKVIGSAEKPRLVVFKSNQNIYVQLIDDLKAHTLASASTVDEEMKDGARCNIEGARSVGLMIAKRAMAQKISQVVFDRSGYLYHGRIKAVADAAREGGLKF